MLKKILFLKILFQLSLIQIKKNQKYLAAFSSKKNHIFNLKIIIKTHLIQKFYLSIKSLINLELLEWVDQF